MLFCLVRFGLKPRIASERMNAGEVRLEKIASLIASSKYSIHDLSRSEARRPGELYRMNMPFELGMDFACRRFGCGHLRGKQILVLEQTTFRYQAALSDMAGIDALAHEGKHELAVKRVRDWLAGMQEFDRRLSERKILDQYYDFQAWYLNQRLSDGHNDADLHGVQVSELLPSMHEWMRVHS
jgi:hypothetical protein